jgi:membrane protease YdiL (CAAX protease family)
MRELLVFIPAAVTAGVWEELFYRGFLMWFLEPASGAASAAVISSLIFGAGRAYQGVDSVFMTRLVGAFIAISNTATGSPWRLMIIQAAVDDFAGALAFRVYSAGRRSRDERTTWRHLQMPPLQQQAFSS